MLDKANMFDNTSVSEKSQKELFKKLEILIITKYDIVDTKTQ